MDARCARKARRRDARKITAPPLLPRRGRRWLSRQRGPDEGPHPAFGHPLPRRGRGESPGAGGPCRIASRIRSSTMLPPPMTISFRTRRMRYPCSRRKLSRRASCRRRASLSCGGPSSSTIKRWATQRKSATYRPMGAWRRNFMPSTCEPRSACQRMVSAWVASRRKQRAKAT